MTSNDHVSGLELPPARDRTRAVKLVLVAAVPALLATACEDAVPTSPLHFPGVDELASMEQPPDPFVTFWGQRSISSADEWMALRRPELELLFQHYVYGFMPDPPEHVAAKETQRIDDLLGGSVRYREVQLTVGPGGAPKISLALFLPKEAAGRVPVVLTLNSCGNQSLVDDPRVHLTRSWVASKCRGAVDNWATETSRGRAGESWMVQTSIERGYALATFHQSDMDPDNADDDQFLDGIQPHFSLEGDRRAHWGALSAWAWGLQRAVDYLVLDPLVDPQRIIVTGHSRRGKAALWAGALDPRIALVEAHQSGTGGATLSRSYGGESVAIVNALFPHWFNDIFVGFSHKETRLPIDQHLLLAMVAPRPLLLSNAEEDTWSDPPGALAAARAADAVYEMLGSEGLMIDGEGNPLFQAPLGWFMRAGEHDLEPDDWTILLDFAETQLARSSSSSY